MDPKVELHRAYLSLMQAPTPETRAAAATKLREAADSFAHNFVQPTGDDGGDVPGRDSKALALAGSALDAMDDEALAHFNRLLPWAAVTIDRRHRRVGGSWSATKRNHVNSLMDRRIVAFDAEYSLGGKHVLELGCFEGIHTLACLLLGARVTGVDGRIENLLKTQARLWAYDHAAQLVLWNLEKAPPKTLPAEWDVLLHVGVLYHLTDPVKHLLEVLPKTLHAVMLDTHVSRDDADASSTYSIAGHEYPYRRVREGNTDISPFAGLDDHAKWLRVEDLHSILRSNGFSKVRTVEDRDERNGRRVLIWAFRS